MSLTITTTHEKSLVQPALIEFIKAVRTQGRTPVVFVPSFQQGLTLSCELASFGLGLGVEVTTPLAWAKKNWELWGDGSHVVEALTRNLVLQQLVAGIAPEDSGGLGFNPGTVEVLSQLAAQALPWLPLDQSGELNPIVVGAARLTPAEKSALRLVGTYEKRIAQAGYCEESRVFSEIVSTLVREGCPLPSVAFVGFDAMKRALRDLVGDLAAQTDVHVFINHINDVAVQSAQSMVQHIVETLKSDVSVNYCDSTASSSEGGANSCKGNRQTGVEHNSHNHTSHSQEIQELISRIFLAQGNAKAEQVQGSVRLALPAGPLAEAECIARVVSELVEDGSRHIIVACQDAQRMWRELARKLEVRNLEAQATYSVPVTQLGAGRAFLEFAEVVARLSELEATWPPAEECEQGTKLTLGDMSWWPPSALSDFLMSDVSHVPLEQALRLDRNWRSNRLLTPEDVLRALKNPKTTSRPVALATTELLKGRLGSAASKLLAPYVDGSVACELADFVLSDEGEILRSKSRGNDKLADTESMGCFAAVLNVAGSLKELGIHADPQKPGALLLSQLVRLAKQALERIAVVVTPHVKLKHARANVSILSIDRAAQLPSYSCDALILCSQTSTESSIADDDDVLHALLQELGIEPQLSTLSELRAQFVHLLSLAKDKLYIECTSFDADSKISYPSVMLSELLSSYGIEVLECGRLRDEALPSIRVGETEAWVAVSAHGKDVAPCASEFPARAGALGADQRRFIVVPPEGHTELLNGKPLLSASQIESYLECPYKWFSLRRLGLSDSDAGFSPMEMGTFVHKIMERTHQQLHEDSCVLEGQTQDLEHAREVLSVIFDEELAAQYIRQGKHLRPQALIAHSAQDEGQLAVLRKDLLSVLDFETTILHGFTPQLFEWSFGRKQELIEYAGAYLVGTIDRVDVDAHGRMAVIDYKHKSKTAFASGEYDVFGPDGYDAEAGFVLPRRVQSLIYAQVVRRHFPDMRVCAAVYMGTKGQQHSLAGAVAFNALDAIYADQLSSSLAQRVCVNETDSFGIEDQSGMPALLDATEAAIRVKIEELLAGNIEANPKDARACAYCPVMNCERRLLS